MIWLLLALTAYFINAVVFIADKYLLESPIPRPYSYTFGVSILSLSSIFLIPFGVKWLGWEYFLISFSSGLVFFLSLIYLYKTIRLTDVSIAATQVGTVNAIFTPLFSVLILNELLNFNNNLALLFLIIGILLMGRTKKHVFWGAIFSGVLFALSFVLLKLSFNMSDFVNGIFWTRMGFIGASFALLTVPRLREEISHTFRKSPKHSKIIFAANKIIAGLAALFLYLAVRLGNVSVINSLLGFQFVITFFLALALNSRIPGLEKELSKRILAEKILGMIFIVIGFIILF